MKPLGISLFLLLAVPRVLAELCSAAPANQPCTPDANLETEVAQEDIRNLIELALQADPTVRLLKAKYLAIKNDPLSSPDQKLKAFENYRSQKIPQDKLYEDAITQTAALYHVNPRNSGEVTVAQSPDPQLQWISGLTAHWRPEATDSGTTSSSPSKSAAMTPRITTAALRA